MVVLIIIGNWLIYKLIERKVLTFPSYIKLSKASRIEYRIPQMKTSDGGVLVIPSKAFVKYPLPIVNIKRCAENVFPSHDKMTSVWISCKLKHTFKWKKNYIKMKTVHGSPLS